jgi:hypothetical protein
VRCGEGKKSNKFATEMNGEKGRNGGGRGECRSVGSRGPGIKSNNNNNNNGEGRGGTGEKIKKKMKTEIRKRPRKVEECSAEQERKQTRCQALVAIACPMPRTQKKCSTGATFAQGQSCRSVGKALGRDLRQGYLYAEEGGKVRKGKGEEGSGGQGEEEGR